MLRTLVRSFVVSGFLLTLAISYHPAYSQATGTIVGTRPGADRANPPATPPASSRAESGPNGQFTLRNLLPGAYMVCVRVKGGGYLDPCTWSPIAPTVKIATGQALTGYSVVVKKGVSVQVRLNDPSRLLQAPATPGQRAPTSG